jgi:hypothetical protein
MGSGPGYPSARAWARECEAKRPPNAGTKLSREKDPVFPKKAFQTNFSHFLRQAKIFKKNYYPLSKNGPEKFIPPNPCCPQGILVFSPVFIFIFFSSFHFLSFPFGAGGNLLFLDFQGICRYCCY